ncbi:hypothetical protein HMPREF2528_06755 [Rothia sp. HMSC078H08]|nr:hypothetical protein HMPREF2528_06755 [Rothia sp. HMSC078H08]
MFELLTPDLLLQTFHLTLHLRVLLLRLKSLLAQFFVLLQRNALIGAMFFLVCIFEECLKIRIVGYTGLRIQQDFLSLSELLHESLTLVALLRIRVTGKRPRSTTLLSDSQTHLFFSCGRFNLQDFVVILHDDS